MSPDSSWDATIYYIDAAKTRVYTEQQSITSYYADVTQESPIKHMADKAAKSVDVRFILSSNNKKETAEANVDLINMTSLIKAASMDTPYLHNKGMICDDRCIVTSVNWTDSSFTSNREMGVLIYSKDVSDFYTTAFIGDFDRNYDYTGLDVTITELADHYNSPQEVTARAVVQQTGEYTYEWQLDGQTLSSKLERISFNAEKGDHSLKVTVTASDGTAGIAVKSFTVDDSGGGTDAGDMFEKIKPYIVPIIVVIIALLLAIVKMSSGGSKKKKGGKKR